MIVYNDIVSYQIWSEGSHVLWQTSSAPHCLRDPLPYRDTHPIPASMTTVPVSSAMIGSPLPPTPLDRREIRRFHPKGSRVFKAWDHRSASSVEHQAVLHPPRTVVLLWGWQGRPSPPGRGQSAGPRAPPPPCRLLFLGTLTTNTMAFLPWWPKLRRMASTACWWVTCCSDSPSTDTSSYPAFRERETRTHTHTHTHTHTRTHTYRCTQTCAETHS